MIEVYPNLFIGSDDDVHPRSSAGMHIVHAAKDPWHRQAVGYQTLGAPKDDPEYFYAIRHRTIALNLIDPADPKFIPDVVINAGLEFIKTNLAAGHRVLVHCNRGHSRSAGLTFLYLWEEKKLEYPTWQEAFQEFCRRYPQAGLGPGVMAYVTARCSGDGPQQQALPATTSGKQITNEEFTARFG